MKIGILTYQNTLNFGASLQSYALYETCKKCGAETEIIDYRNERITEATKPISVINKRGSKKINPIGIIKYLFVYPLVAKKKKSFRKFQNNFMKYGKQVFHSKDEIMHAPPIYDKYIIGSDQVWNYNINGMDTTYFMDFVQDKSKLMSFSSSFGLERIDENKEEIYKYFLDLIPIISVREEIGAEIIFNLTGKKVTVINDPVFLLNKDEWLKIASNKKRKSKNHIVSYFLNYNTRLSFENLIENEISLKKLKVAKLAGGIKINDFINTKVKVDYSNGPIDFINYINDAKYICTDSFHATVFSILLNKQFIVFLSGDKGRDSRIINLLKIFNLENRIYNKDATNSLDDPINFDNVNEICDALKSEGMSFLKENLK
ncbi:polysaccharide pyruvyl transferase family protein [Paenibacillus sp. RS8]|uniref:polysaccharide pyruvyl transferase family protein n=1 Tax=Paenibacillus sp. RS8 TaxID=3242681 RepID=UPI0035C139D5